MKKFWIVFLMQFSFSQVAFPCAFDYQINKSELENLPILAYIDVKGEVAVFYLYIKDEGNFKGISSVELNISTQNDQPQFIGSLKIDHIKGKEVLTIGTFSVNKGLIPMTFLRIVAYQEDKSVSDGLFTRSVSVHSSVFIYEIRLEDVYVSFKSKDNAYTTHSLYNKYEDDTLKAFLNKRFEMKRGHDL